MSFSLEIIDRGRRRKPPSVYNGTRCPGCRRNTLYPYRENEFNKGEAGMPKDPRQPFLLACHHCGYRAFQTKLDTPYEDFERIFGYRR